MTRLAPHVHLVGSVPLSSADEVFRTAAGKLGPYLDRIPDGETGERTNWVRFQRRLLAGHPAIEEIDGRLRPRAGVDPAGVTFGDLGYARAAIDSYATFARLKSEGVLPAGVRFQVSLPTPLALMVLYLDLPDQLRLEPAYRSALLAELDRVLAAVPADQLAVQWDVAPEMGLLEGVWPAPFDDVTGEVAARLAALAGLLPIEVPVGFHFCYGDLGHQHFVQPKDTATVVGLAAEVRARMARPPAWIHLPVPRDRADEPYFAPLGDLTLDAGTRLFLGLVHATDGVPGARARIAAAETAGRPFGIGTECGFGRRDPASVGALLDLHRELLDG